MIVEHNREFVALERMYLLRSARKLSTEKGNALMSIVNAWVRTIDACSYMTDESGGAFRFFKKRLLQFH